MFLTIFFIIVIILYVFFYGTKTGKEIHNNVNEKSEASRMANYNATHTSTGMVKCPKCGSTQIQLVNKKWSATSGFLTNKVNRVCVSCKHKF